MRLRASILAAAGLWALVCGTTAPAAAQRKLDTVSPRDPRRTPVVEVFHRWKASVVYLTGPIASGPQPAADEFFQIPFRREMISIGSGFVVHEAGYIVTNAHAVERVIAHHVTLIDGRTYAAEVVGIARECDLALLKVESGRLLPPVQLGKSGDFLLGETIIVISNPSGLLHTCTTGIISAADRMSQPAALPGITLHGLIQTDASINPGSSGGPWFNVLGEVVGLTTAMQKDAQNIGFGISAATVRQMLPEMLDVERRQCIDSGIRVLEQPAEPCVVADVAANSPAASAGIHAGDVIKVVDGRTIFGRCEYCLSLAGHRAGDSLQMELLRGDRSVEATLVLDPRSKPNGEAILKQRFGLAAEPLSEEKAYATRLRVHRGVVITGVAPGCTAG